MPRSFLTDEQLLEWLQVCRTLQSLKELARQGSMASGFNRGDADSVAAHTSLVGLMSLTLSLELKVNDNLNFDPGYIAAMALVHDLSSAILGDISSEVKRHYLPEYQRFERVAFHDLVNGLKSSEELLELFDECQAHKTVSAKIVRFTDGLDAWLEVIPRSSLAWMQQHEDYRDYLYEQLRGDQVYGDSLAEMFLQVCKVLKDHRIGPKRPAVSPLTDKAESDFTELNGLILSSEQMVEWLQVCQTFQRLKRLTRQGFITSGGFNRWDTDSIADHVGLVALISFTLALELRICDGVDIDPNHVATLALVHDLGESILGDVNSEAKRRYFADYDYSEKLAIKDLLGQLLGGEYLLTLYDEFDACDTMAAKVVRFADSLDAWQRVTARASQTWMPQHIEYRNRTFRKLKGDELYGDLLAELFLRACLVIQGQPVGPKRFVHSDSSNPTDFTSQVTSEISHRIRELRLRQQSLKRVLDRSQNDDEIDSLVYQEDIIREELAYAMQTLIGLKGRLFEGKARDV